ncbi:hypothetical protein ACFFV7_53625 [Nonomuraea spiralis]|uniref:Uncharacterized protein n=1 Tax=Nonomuraea spiralis TaxID=46182 RepID=A0ABV5IZV2_9ACTN|nr:hypothetical protein [Nonomuraea spiralis]GGT16448.1 hypothetical protein GCM10010176_071200 [Nonomuraea spiralis]
MNGPYQYRDVCFELGELLVLVRDGLLQLGDLGAEPDLDVRGRATCFDLFVELVLQVGVALCEGVALDLRFLGKRDDGQGAVGVFGPGR